MKEKELEDLLNNFTDTTNRSMGQTKMLFDLCDGDFHKLVSLEEKLKNNHVSWCPGDKEEVSMVLNMPDKKSDFCFYHEFKISRDPQNKWTLIFTGKEGIKHFVAVPPTEGSRTDYLSNKEGSEWMYYYSEKPKGFRGLNIPIQNGEILLNCE